MARTKLTLLSQKAKMDPTEETKRIIDDMHSIVKRLFRTKISPKVEDELMRMAERYRCANRTIVETEKDVKMARHIYDLNFHGMNESFLRLKQQADDPSKGIELISIAFTKLHETNRLAIEPLGLLPEEAISILGQYVV